MRRITLIAALMVLASCRQASPVVTGADHPANPDAPTSPEVAGTPGASPAAPARDGAAAGRESGGGDAAPAKTPSAAPALYRCPMHPEVTSKDPSAVCPKCGMKINQPVRAESPR